MRALRSLWVFLALVALGKLHSVVDQELDQDLRMRSSEPAEQ